MAKIQRNRGIGRGLRRGVASRHDHSIDAFLTHVYIYLLR
jgi:hypothetical protein